MAFHRRQLSLYSSKKIVEVAPAVTQGEGPPGKPLISHRDPMGRTVYFTYIWLTVNLW